MGETGPVTGNRTSLTRETGRISLGASTIGAPSGATIGAPSGARGVGVSVNLGAPSGTEGGRICRAPSGTDGGNGAIDSIGSRVGSTSKGS